MPPPGKEPPRANEPLPGRKQKQLAPIHPRSAGQRQKGGPLHALRGTLGAAATHDFHDHQDAKGGLDEVQIQGGRVGSRLSGWGAGAGADFGREFSHPAGWAPPRCSRWKLQRAREGRLGLRSAEERRGSGAQSGEPGALVPPGGGAGAAAWLPGARPEGRSGCWLAAPGGGGRTSRAVEPHPPQPCPETCWAEDPRWEPQKREPFYTCLHPSSLPGRVHTTTLTSSASRKGAD